MPGTHGYITLPPDGSGKQTPQSVMVEINYTNGTSDFSVGDEITFSSSSWTATVIEVKGTTNSGEIHLRVHEPVPNTITVVQNEDILVDLSKYAEVSSTTIGIYYFPQMVLAGGDNMVNTLQITSRGAAQATFYEGSPQFDSFGRMQSSIPHKLADYVLSYDELPNDFTDTVTGSASLAYEPNVKGVALTCTTSASDSYIRTSDEYHIYQAGVSQYIVMTCACGDTGKANVDRFWGYFDDENGLFFKLQGTTFGAVIRSKSTGSVVDTFIPQTQWNVDRLDGTSDAFNPSGKNLDLSKDVIYWMDFQWLGAGHVRFGVFMGNERILCHVEQHSNITNVSYMSSPSLPIRYGQTNTGIPTSSSEFRFFCATVFTESTFNPFKRAFTTDLMKATATNTTSTPFMCIKPVTTYKSKTNRSVIYPNNFTVYNSSSTVPVLFELYRNGVPSDGSFSAVGGESVAEINDTLTSFTGGSKRMSKIIGPGQSLGIDFKTFQENRRGLRLKADASDGAKHVYCTRLLEGTGSVDVFMVLNWDEVRD